MVMQVPIGTLSCIHFVWDLDAVVNLRDFLRGFVHGVVSLLSVVSDHDCFQNLLKSPNVVS